MNGPLIAAGSLAVVATAIHGAGGELIVVRKLSLESLPRTRFGGPRMTKTMLHVSWHIATAAFLTVAVGLLLAGSALDGDTADAVAVLAAAGATGFAAVAVGLGFAYMRSPKFLFRHLGPLALTAIAVLAWLGIAV